MHPLVARQLRKAGLAPDPADASLTRFITAVSDAYVAADQDRRQLELSLNLASDELNGRNRRLEAELASRAAMERALADAARRDRLTGLASRAYFLEKLERGVKRIVEGQQSLLAVLYLDFDRFKFVNDTLGHDAGDELLVQIAGRLRGEFGDGDGVNGASPSVVVSRFGGDEFLVLLNDIVEPGDAANVADRLLDALAPVYRIRGREVHSSASIGVVTSDQCSPDADELVRNADVAMYEAKRSGRGRRLVFDRSMRTRLARRVSIEHALRHAVERGEMRLAYQPIVDLATGRTSSAEALLRWTHPSLGSIPPSEFVPLAEETGQIIAIGEWVQREACETLKRWRTADPERAPEMISVNVSRAELALGSRMLEQVRATLDRAGLSPGRLQLEITEREIMRDPEVARKLLRALGELGVKIAMDDFGTGNSSLGFLRNYPFDTIKIDRSFVHDLTGSPDGLAVLHAAVTLIENLGMKSVVEGVEELSQVAVLQSLGCRAAQGFWFGEAVPEDDFLAVVAARRPYLRRVG
jgi:diguanylate cyclase (GGDEF)-like protein